jgi:trehalose-phosphatase
MAQYQGYFNRIVAAAKQGKLLWMPDQDGATVMKPVGVHSGFEPETDLERDYRILLNAGNAVVPNTGRPEIFFRAAYPNIHKDFWIVSEMGARITGPGGKIEFEKNLPNRTHLIEVLESELKNYPGGFIEDGKVCAITIALTGATERDKAYNHLLRLVSDMARGSSDMHIKSGFLPYNTHIELVPSNVDKGSATEFFVNHDAFKDHLIVCVGDSDPDADMMAVANDVGGISIGVGSRAPDNVHFSFQNPDQVQLFVRQLASCITNDMK